MILIAHEKFVGQGKRKKRKRTEELEPVGTAFAISESLILTANHNVKPDDKCILMKEYQAGIEVAESQIIRLTYVASNKEEDWAILRVPDTAKLQFTDISSEAELPEPDDEIVIADYPSGLLEGTHKVVCSTTKVQVDHYENKTTPTTSPQSRPAIVVQNPRKRAVVEDAVHVREGRVRGSCGGPYFFNNKAFAFHRGSVNDDIDGSQLSGRSHSSNSVGRVLSRLPKFKKRLAVNLKKTL